ncbi:MAG: TrkH family potassium uptake protein [Bacilli bacterium]|nr:TrkH family potassium uptake protein [Bacilli bacterium]
MKKNKMHISPTRRIAFSFFMVIIIGALLLSLPVCHTSDIPFIDHLFTATSATCVTGLVSVVVAEEYTLLGQMIIILMIQIGGLGFLTLMSMFLVKFKKRLSYTNKIVMQEALNQNSLKDIEIFIQRVIKYTFFFESIGALLLVFEFVPDYGLKGLYYAVFHSISAFCNAGFDVLGSSSLIAYQDNLLVNLTISFLIIAGGLGFVVWIELKDKIIAVFKRKIRFKKMLSSLSVHSKIVISMTCLLLISGTVLFFCLEYNNTLSGLSLPVKLLISFFQSVTLRTAGFASVNMAMLKDATKLFMCIYMFIGGSPAGTAGGIKTVTFAMILLSCYSLIEGNDHISVFKRKISQVIVKRALMISFISLSMTLVALMILSVSENQSFINLMFEVYSAFATVGLTAAVTPLLTNVGKLVVIFLMYIGRIGPITMLLIFVKRYNQLNGKEIEYPHGDVLIG